MVIASPQCYLPQGEPQIQPIPNQEYADPDLPPISFSNLRVSIFTATDLYLVVSVILTSHF